MGRRYGTVSPPRVRNLITVPADAVVVHVPKDMFWGKGCPYSLSFREQSFSETEELLFVLPSPLIYYPLNEQPMRFRIRYLGKD